MNDNRPTIAEVVDKLMALGSADQIAQHFEAEGVVFTGGSMSWNCPVSQYVQRETGNAIAATSRWVTARDLDVSEHVDLDREEPVSQFIQGFDNGAYPRLGLVRTW